MRTVTCDIEIDTTKEQIIHSFTNAEMLKGWWGVEKSCIDLKPGGIYALAWGLSEAGMRYISTGIIKDYEKESILHIGDYMYLSTERPFLGPLSLIIETTATANGASLHLQQGPYPKDVSEDWEWYYNVVSEAWPKVLLELKNYLENEV
ncbi:MAG: SRPBCC domain-containing protein [Chitinophagaceae bacterium]|nr:SRPBCC domain-containing protein [Chitinophagaceae bacterium]